MFSPAVDAHWELPPPEAAQANGSLDTSDASASLVGSTAAASWQPPQEPGTGTWLGSTSALGVALALLVAAFSLMRHRGPAISLLRTPGH